MVKLKRMQEYYEDIPRSWIAKLSIISIPYYPNQLANSIVPGGIFHRTGKKSEMNLELQKIQNSQSNLEQTEYSQKHPHI